MVKDVFEKKSFIIEFYELKSFVIDDFKEVIKGKYILIVGYSNIIFMFVN